MFLEDDAAINEMLYFRKSEAPVLLKILKKGKLGHFPACMNRLRAGLMLANDYRFSFFMPKVTASYEQPLIKGRSGAGAAMVSRYDAADRYLQGLKAVGKYRLYALHFLRDDKNVLAFISENPVLNKGHKTTYKMVYRNINAMLDILVDFYDGMQR